MKKIVEKRKDILKLVAFITIFILIFGILQKIIIPKWYYPNQPLPDPVGRIMPGFYTEEEDSIDVIFLGTSVSHFGISPMEIYEANGIKSYNLSSSAQPIEVSYFLLKEALRNQKPKVVVLDIISLFCEEREDSTWRYMLDTMNIGRNKYEFAKEYTYYKRENDRRTIIEAMVPLLNYHERWKELSERDFTDFFRNKNFYSKGYYILSRQSAGMSIEEMNSIEDMLYALPSEGMLREYYDDNFFQKELSNLEYVHDTVSNNSLRWLLKINRLCEDNNIKLVAIKVPMSYSPIINKRAWTNKKHSIADSACQQFGIEFLDMEYDADIGIDWMSDTPDGGTHLNLLGAKKVSAFLGQYLLSEYDLSTERIETWNLDLQVYQKIRDIALLQMETNFTEYINRLLYEASGKTIFISAADEMSFGLNNQERLLLKELGMQSDFSDAYRKSYLAIIENGIVKYEGLSDDKIEYEGSLCDSELEYRVISSGYYTNSMAQIFINDIDYAVGGRGLSFVVYDNESEMVLDSVCFDTCDAVHTANRNQSANSEYLRKFENYMIENEARK